MVGCGSAFIQHVLFLSYARMRVCFQSSAAPHSLSLFLSLSNARMRVCFYSTCRGGRVVLGKLPVPGRPTIWITVGQGLAALAEGAGGGCLDIFSLIYHFYLLSPSLWEMARYRLKCCLKGPLNPNQPTNQPFILHVPLSVSNTWMRVCFYSAGPPILSLSL